jgi:hypothetical protein
LEDWFRKQLNKNDKLVGLISEPDCWGILAKRASINLYPNANYVHGRIIREQHF